MRSLIFIALFYSSTAFGQIEAQLHSGVILMTQPTNILDFWNGPNVNLGAEYKLKGRYKNFTMLGCYTESFKPFTQYQWESLHGGFIQNEIRRYYLRIDTTAHYVSPNYWGLEFVYGYQSYYRQDTIPINSEDVFYRYHNTRQFAGISINYGFQAIYNSGLVLGINVGLGIRYNEVINELTEDQASHRNFGDWNNPTGWIQQKGGHIIPKFNMLGFKIGYRFKK